MNDAILKQLRDFIEEEESRLADLKRFVRHVILVSREDEGAKDAFVPRHDPEWEKKLPKKH